MAQCAASNMKEERPEERCRGREVIRREKRPYDRGNSEFILMVPGLRSECARRIS